MATSMAEREVSSSSQGIGLSAHRYIAVSRDLAQWLVRTTVRPTASRKSTTASIRPLPVPGGPACADRPGGFITPETFVIGTVGRMEPVKVL